MENFKITVKGRVQGVGFRYAAKNMARSLALNGFVKNLPDQSVYMEIEGEEEKIRDYIRWCRLGPERAIVKDVVIEKGTFQNYGSFDTKF
jgi:acylphosphatase